MQYFFVSALHSLPAFLSGYIGYSGYIEVKMKGFGYVFAEKKLKLPKMQRKPCAWSKPPTALIKLNGFINN
jgi:hypothetical protein